MEQPPGYADPLLPNHVCKLKKALYNLKQAPRAWFERFITFLYHISFRCSIADNSMFIFHHGTDIIVHLLYVDDIILTGSTLSLLSHLITQLSKEFAMKDVGDIHYFLGIEVLKISDWLFLSQSKNIKDLLTPAQMLDCKPISTLRDGEGRDVQNSWNVSNLRVYYH